MNKHPKRTAEQSSPRRGVIAPLLAILSVPMIGMVAFSVDYGYLTVIQSELQRAADAAVLSAVIDLVPNDDGSQNLGVTRARVVEYVQANLANSPAGDSQFTVLDGDIEVGRYDRTTINDMSQPVVLMHTGRYDAVRVTLRRDASANGPVSLFFARLLGVDEQPLVVTATAVLRQASGLKDGVYILPFAIPVNFWDSLDDAEVFRIYNDNTISDGYGNQVTVVDDLGNPVPGSWGTVDIGLLNNSTRNLEDQMMNGLLKVDIDTLYAEGRIGTNEELPLPVNFQADTGLSSGMKDVVRAIQGEKRLIPLYDSINGEFASGGSGNNAEFHIVAWGVIEVGQSNWNGNNNTWIEGSKGFTFDGALKAIDDLTQIPADDIVGNIGNAYAAPVLVR